jgi:hypothetical protein
VNKNMASKWITKKSKSGGNIHIPINNGNRIREREINPKRRTLDQKTKNLKWHTGTEYAYSDIGVDNADVFRTGICYKGKCYDITVYPLELISQGFDGWEYRISVSKNGEVIDEYDPVNETNDHFSTIAEAQSSSILTLEEMLEGGF